MGLPLTCRPKFVYQIPDWAFPHLDRRLAELTEIPDEITKWRPSVVAHGFPDGGNSLE
jgi:hypothetical protein